jgi:hypothetical protein
MPGLFRRKPPFLPPKESSGLLTAMIISLACFQNMIDEKLGD